MTVQASRAPAAVQAESPTQLTDLNHLAQTERTRARVIEELVAQGVDASRAGRVAEAFIRRDRARRTQQVFRYCDVEEQFEALCRSSGADPESIELAKQRVWAIALHTSERHGCAIEEALFFCYCESLYLHSAILAA